jgi:YHS domain-containing protein
MRLIKSLFVAAALALTTAPAAFADQDPVYTGRFSNVAVQGYDPVAYFTEGAPTKGSSQFSTSYRGAEYRFATEENLQRFLKAPEKYAPQYGGYCAWAISQGYTAKGDARHWKIVDGKLYLNFNRKIQERWETDIDGFITAADDNWPTVLED